MFVNSSPLLVIESIQKIYVSHLHTNLQQNIIIDFIGLQNNKVQMLHTNGSQIFRYFGLLFIRCVFIIKSSGNLPKAIFDSSSVAFRNEAFSTSSWHFSDKFICDEPGLSTTGNESFENIICRRNIDSNFWHEIIYSSKSLQVKTEQLNIYHKWDAS